MARKARSFAPWTLDALTVLGRQISSERRSKGWTQAELAERSGIVVATLANIEKGSPTSAIGIVFEVAALLGIPLVGASEPLTRQLVDTRYALLPARVRRSKEEIDDDF